MNYYKTKINTVIEYIYINLDSSDSNNLSLEKLSQVANFSKYHFARVFSNHTGLTVYRFVQRLKLKRAAYKLAFHPDEKVVDIAFESGFDSHEAFSRSFKKLFHSTPKSFRKEPNWEHWETINQFKRGSSMKALNIEIINFEKQPVALLEHRGSPAKLNHSVAKFIEWRKSTTYSPVQTARTFGIAYHDPKTVSPDEFKFDICGSVDSSIDENPQGVTNSCIPAGRCAMVIHKGSHDQMEETIYYLYQEWLSSTGEKLRDFPCFFEYKNFFPEVAESGLITHIYLPIE